MKKSVLITGSSRGLGRELAIVFANNDYDVVLHGRDKVNLYRVKEDISKYSVKCSLLCGDLRASQTLDALYNISRENRLSVLINNAGVALESGLEKMDDQQIEEILTTNLSATIKLTRRLYTLFLKFGGGTIININSILGKESSELKSVYCASKCGLRGFTNAFRLEAQKNNVRVIEVYPTRIKTKPEYTYGMEPLDVARKIYDTFTKTSLDELILDNRFVG